MDANGDELLENINCDDENLNYCEKMLNNSLHIKNPTQEDLGKESCLKKIGLVCAIYILGVKVRNMKMDFNTGVTWCRFGQQTLMMKMYDFFYSAKLISCLV